MKRGTVMVLAVVAVSCGPVVASPAAGSTTGTDASDEVSTAATASTSSLPSTSSSSTSSGSTGSDSTEDTGLPTNCISPWPNVTLIACAPNPGRGSLASDGTSVFFESDGAIYQVDAFDGGKPQTLADDAGDVAAIAVSGGRLFWVSFFDGTVGQVTLPPGPITQMGGISQPSSAAIRSPLLFVTEYVDDGAVLRYDTPLDGTFEVLYQGLDHPGHVVPDGDSLYFAVSTNNGNVPTPILRGTVDGAAVTTVYSDTGSIEDMVLDGSQMFVARYRVEGSSIEVTPLDDPASTEVLAAIPAHPFELALTSDRVYWTDWDNDTSVATLASVEKTGGAIVTHVGNGSPLSDIVVVADDVIVFRTPDGVARLDA